MTLTDVRPLLQRLAAVEERIRTVVSARRATDPNPDDALRGLYLSDDDIDRLLTRRRENHPVPPKRYGSAETGGRLAELKLSGGLDEIDLDLLVTALAADLEPRFESLFGYLNDDVTRRRPSIAVAFELCGLSLASAADRGRLQHGPLVATGILEVQDPDRPFASRALRVPDRVVAHLLGDDTPTPDLAHLLVAVADIDWGDVSPIHQALRDDVRLIYIRQRPTGSARVLASTALRQLGRGVVHGELPPARDATEVADNLRLLAREAQLRQAVLVVGPVSELVAHPGTVDRLPTAVPTILVGSDSWDPSWSAQLPLLVDAPATTAAQRSQQWAAHLPDAPASAVAATAAFRLSPEQVHRAATAARTQARAEGTDTVTARHIAHGARAENGTALERLARRIEPAVSWDDLVVPPSVLTALREVAARAKHREQVLGDWGMRPGGGRGHGVAALFAGDSGTGKTMSAEVVAHDLGLDLYVVNLATTVDKYIGETEKNLDKILRAADEMNAVLLFDEADSIFGKRSEVKDAHDRYANIESAYLLQRMESFDGLIILATNLRANIDEAFTRRLDVVVDFPLPEAEDRRRLWDLCLGTAIPRAPDIDLDFCAHAFELAGGAIRSAAVTAAYLAAADGGPLTMTHVVIAIQREYRKLGRLTLREEFGPYWSLLDHSDTTMKGEP